VGLVSLYLVRPLQLALELKLLKDTIVRCY
jgi:hypothetical protein